MKETNVIVIGGSYGIGRYIADALAENNINVTVLSRTPPLDAAKRVCTALHWMKLDLSNLKQSRVQIKKIGKAFAQKLDAVFYSPVYYGPRRAIFLEADEHDWQQQLSVNLYGLWLTLKYLLPALERRAQSLFVHVTSDVILNSGPWRAGYAATKAAASNLIDSLAKEKPDYNVQLVQLIPGILAANKFDYKNPRLPLYIQQAAVQLFQAHGEQMHGKILALNKNGKLLSLKSNYCANRI
jgi:NAD(P)-dependent dehydrogenase (short-subunit alcohol dehydrogenase family)